MSTDELIKLMQRYPELVSVSDGDGRSVLEKLKLVEISRNSPLLNRGQRCDQCMWLLEGTVRVFISSAEGREITLYRVEAGDLCALTLSALVSGGSVGAEAVAETPVRGLFMERGNFTAALDTSASFRLYVIRTLADRLAETTQLLNQVAFERLDLRLACRLGQLFERSQGESVSITHENLARDLGTTREVVSRMLKEFERLGCIRCGRGQIRLVSPMALEKFREGGGMLERKGGSH